MPEGSILNSAPPAPPSPAPAPAVDPNKDRDLAELKKLEAEYAKLKAASEENTKFGRPNAETQARKGDVFRQVTAIKRKHRLPQ